MKAVTGKVMQSLDRRTIDEFKISGLDLMEKAGQNCVDLIKERYGSTVKQVVIIAGRGNNGGDGYVIARLLSVLRWNVDLFVISSRDKITGDAKVNLDRLPKVFPVYINDESGLKGLAQALEKAEIIVDALLGTGLNTEVEGLYASVINMINSASAYTVSVDIPSGIDSATGKVLGCSVKAACTVTFAVAKLGHLLYPGAEYTGDLFVTDIGIPKGLIDRAEGIELIDQKYASTLLIPRSRTAHKGSNGHALVIAGSTGKSGAAAMAGNSAMRSGAGLVTLAVPESIHNILEIKTTEVMTVPLLDNNLGFLGKDTVPEIARQLKDKAVMALGPGIGWDKLTSELVRDLVKNAEIPIVIDADGLNAISEDLSVLGNSKSAFIIMTPHPGEMARLTNLTVAEVEEDRLGVARSFAVKHSVYLILKGARTVIAAPDGKLALNKSGNPGMASGGMGDVLTGIVTALVAQGYEPFKACCLGVFVHGFAGDLVAKEKGEIGLIATDLQEMLPYALKKLIEI
ncbi:MAG: NAD(P)H-hydrate dehydratase [Desulfuromonadales bacterium]|nr:NAD(P)H-hydrate dehydratase [Desulfuromonadales bacterium]